MIFYVFKYQEKLAFTKNLHNQRNENVYITVKSGKGNPVAETSQVPLARRPWQIAALSSARAARHGPMGLRVQAPGTISAPREPPPSLQSQGARLGSVLGWALTGEERNHDVLSFQGVRRR